MAEATGWLVDRSALVRLAVADAAEQWVERIDRGLLHIATITLLETGVVGTIRP